MKLRLSSLLLAFLFAALSMAAQTRAGSSATALVPPVIQFSNVATDGTGNPLEGTVEITFSLYNNSQGGQALWSETQNVALDSTGHYSVYVGITKPNGVPASLFTNGTAHWLDVQIAGQPNQPRVFLVSVPYAMKAGDASTVGGLPPSAFVQAAAGSAASGGATTTATAPLPISKGTITGVTAGTDLTGGGTSGNVTLNLDTTKVPQLASANTFTAAQTIKATTIISGTNTSGVLQVTNTVKSGSGPAIVGTADTTDASAVKGIASATTGTSNGVYGKAASPGGFGVYGTVTATTGTSAGVYGQTSSTSGYGVYGNATATSGTTSAGVYGNTNNSNGGYGVEGLSPGGSGVYGQTYGNNATSYGVQGVTTDFQNGAGVYGSGGTGVEGVSTQSSTTTFGPGGMFTGFMAPTGTSMNGTDGVDSYGGNGDQSRAGTNGGAAFFGMAGNATLGGIDGVGGWFYGGCCAGSTGDGVVANAGSEYAGVFNGNVTISGVLTSGTKDFKIDHPLDPANKYLVHASVESSEMMNIYTGNITTDSRGEATVQLPGWFEVLNTDFRYQLTVIGQFAQAIVASEIREHQFQIKTSVPNVKVSWQVTGVRQDAFAKAHPLVVEEQKEARLRGFYLHPELYGAPAEKQMEWARHPQMMKRAKAARTATTAAVAQKGPVPTSH